MINNLGRLVLVAAVLLISNSLMAQVNSVQFGKNRIQYKKFNWKYYQTPNFNTYFAQEGLELGKYVAQVAEAELSSIEEFVEYGLQRRANIVVCNNFDEMQQSNIGLGIDWQNAGGVTKLVNNKMMVYYNSDRNHLRRQIREGIAGVLVANMLFGDDLGEMAANQTLLDLPKWLVDGYVAYAAEEWNSELDDQLKSALLSGNYNNFYQLAFEKPLLAGHAFWYYFGNKYGKSKTTYLLYLARIYRNLNSATQRIGKKKFKEVLREFMTDQSQMYFKDIRGRRIVPKGQLSVVKEVDRRDYFRFNANPQARSFTYAVVEFKEGKYQVVLNENFTNRRVILSYGVRTREDEMNPSYPILSWDGKGTRLAVTYYEEGKVKLFVYDALNHIKLHKQELTMFSQVQDVKYMLTDKQLLMSAVRNGQSDIYVYNLEKQTFEQVTNDVYDDLDPAFVAFPNKTGIIFSSNRPSPNAPSSETSMPAENYNIFLVDNWNRSEFKQISQLTNVRFGNARFPSQYNASHFTFVSDESGINNRYAGFFSTEAAGLDTLVFIGDEILRNPTEKDVDSLLKEWNQPDIDSVGYFAVSNDSAYVFPLTNYQSSLLETRTAGDNSLVSEVTRQGDYKFLYRLRVDENALRRRNITTRPTEFRRRTIEQARMEANRANQDSSIMEGKGEDFFQSEFGDERRRTDTTATSTEVGTVHDTRNLGQESVLKKAKLFEYRPPKFFNDYVVAGLNNTVFVPNKYQPYAGGAGPIDPANGGDLNGLIRMGTIDLFEDYRISGGFRVSTNLRDNDVLFEFTNQRKRLDWGFTYFRSSQGVGFLVGPGSVIPGKSFSNYYLARFSYPFDRVRSLRATIGPRFDRLVLSSINVPTLKEDDITQTYGQLSLEYVHDNTIYPAMNIWKGLRWKAYVDGFRQLNQLSTQTGRNIFNVGIDARHYLPIYRNIIWAVRGAADFSWGNQKVIYYLGGVDGWLKFGQNEVTDPTTGETRYRYFDPNNRPDPDVAYAYQALAVNMRGFKQNIANGNNAVVINSEIRVPVFSSFLNRPINNALIRNFQIVQFFDLGTAWNGKYDAIERPNTVYGMDPVTVRIKAGGIGPLAGGYGFGARSTILGYFLRFDVAWQMDGIFRGKPMTYLALGLDF